MAASDKLIEWIQVKVETGEYFRFPYCLGDTVSVGGMPGKVTFVSIHPNSGAFITCNDIHYLESGGDYDWIIRVVGRKVVVCHNDTLPVLSRRVVLTETIN